MAETDVHRDLMVELLNALKEHFRNDPQVYVTGNLFLYYLDEEGERQFVSPDIFIVRGIEKRERRYYKLEDEGKAPDVVIELISRHTKVEDLGTKRFLYASFGVREYFLFDPLAESLKPQLRGFRLEGEEYVPIVGTRLQSEVLGLDLVFENNQLRLYDHATGERLRTHEESEAARRAAEERLVRELAARQAAEAEVARLREELAQLRSGKA